MICPKRAVVVVFPFVPVIARTSPFPNTYASSISPQIGMLFSRIFSTIGRSVGTPGLITTNESSSIISSGNVPSTILNCPFSFLVSKILASISSAHSFSFPSYKTTSAPFSSKSLHDPSPLIPEPKTSTFFPLISIFIPPSAQ